MCWYSSSLQSILQSLVMEVAKSWQNLTNQQLCPTCVTRRQTTGFIYGWIQHRLATYLWSFNKNISIENLFQYNATKLVLFLDVTLANQLLGG